MLINKRISKRSMVDYPSKPKEFVGLTRQNLKELAATLGSGIYFKQHGLNRSHRRPNDDWRHITKSLCRLDTDPELLENERTRFDRLDSGNIHLCNSIQQSKYLEEYGTSAENVKKP